MSDRVDFTQGLPVHTPRGGTQAPSHASARAGKIRPMILMWALGVPIPIIIIIFLIRGCM